MNRFSMSVLTVVLALSLLASPLRAQRIVEVTDRVRGELAVVLKKESSSLPLDKPVIDLGADELRVAEWVKAVEAAFVIDIPDDRIFDPKTKKTRYYLTIASVTAIVHTALRSAEEKKKAKTPNQSPEPTAPSGRGSS